MPRPSVSLAFALALSATLAAFALDDPVPLLAISAAFLAMAGRRLRRVAWVFALLAASAPGVLLNAALFAGGGRVVVQLPGLALTEGALRASAAVLARLLAIAAAGAWFVTGYGPVEVARGLERELGLPKGVAFAVAYAFRSLPLVARDFEEVRAARKQRGYRLFPITPGDFSSYLVPLVRAAYERAVWTGVSMELRGFSIRRVERRPRLFYK